jgi:hypothetical protein
LNTLRIVLRSKLVLRETKISLLITGPNEAPYDWPADADDITTTRSQRVDISSELMVFLNEFTSGPANERISTFIHTGDGLAALADLRVHISEIAPTQQSAIRLWTNKFTLVKTKFPLARIKKFETLVSIFNSFESVIKITDIEKRDMLRTAIRNVPALRSINDFISNNSSDFAGMTYIEFKNRIVTSYTEKAMSTLTTMEFEEEMDDEAVAGESEPLVDPDVAGPSKPSGKRSREDISLAQFLSHEPSYKTKKEGGVLTNSQAKALKQLSRKSEETVSLQARNTKLAKENKDLKAQVKAQRILREAVLKVADAAVKAAKAGKADPRRLIVGATSVRLELMIPTIASTVMILMAEAKAAKEAKDRMH